MCKKKKTKIAATKAEWFDLCGMFSRNSASTQEIDAGLTTRNAFEIEPNLPMSVDFIENQKLQQHY